MTEKKLALVTGASRGIGREIACRLAVTGYHVVLVARTEAGLAETDDLIHQQGGTATIAPLDLASSEDVDRLAAVVGKRWGRLDLLVLNAAMLGSLGPLAHATPQEFESVIELNLVAQWRLIRDFDAMLRIARGTVVAVTSSVGSRPRAYWGAYSVSKAGLENMAALYAGEMHKLGVNVLLVDPGATRTRMRAQAYPGEEAAKVKAPQLVAGAIVDALPGLAAGLTRLAVAADGTATVTSGFYSGA